MPVKRTAPGAETRPAEGWSFPITHFGDGIPSICIGRRVWMFYADGTNEIALVDPGTWDDSGSSWDWTDGFKKVVRYRLERPLPERWKPRNTKGKFA